MATKYVRVLLTFTNQSDHQIEEIAGVVTGMTGNKNYPKKWCQPGGFKTNADLTNF